MTFNEYHYASIESLHITENDLISFADNLKNNKIAKLIDIDNLSPIDINTGMRQTIDENGIKYLSEFIKTNNMINDFTINSYYISPNSIDYIIDMLKENKSIEELDISNCTYFNDANMKKLSETLMVNRTLKKIRLDDIYITKSMLKYLVPGLKNNTTVISINMFNNHEFDPNLDNYTYCNALCDNKNPDVILINNFVKRNQNILIRKSELKIMLMCCARKDIYLQNELWMIICNILIKS